MKTANVAFYGDLIQCSHYYQILYTLLLPHSLFYIMLP